MHHTRTIIATLAAAITMMAVAGVWHEVVMARFYDQTQHASHDGIALLFAAYLILGLMMTLIYPRLQLKGSTFLRGLTFGMFIGLLWVFPHQLAMAGAHGEPLDYVFKNAAWHLVEQGIGGLVIAFFYQRQQTVTARRPEA